MQEQVNDTVAESILMQIDMLKYFNNFSEFFNTFYKCVFSVINDRALVARGLCD